MSHETLNTVAVAAWIMCLQQPLTSISAMVTALCHGTQVGCVHVLEGGAWGGTWEGKCRQYPGIAQSTMRRTEARGKHNAQCVHPIWDTCALTQW